jgi:hypothetical protein
VSGYLSAFVWHAFEGVAREHGLTLDEADGSIRLVDDGRSGA